MNIVTICREFEFDSAHHLDWHDGKCKNLHGHTYKLRVYAKGELNENGVVQDFGDLKQLVNEVVVDKYDHTYLNSFFDNPTAEIMAKKILVDLRRRDKTIFKIRLYETPVSYAEVEVAGN